MKGKHAAMAAICAMFVTIVPLFMGLMFNASSGTFGLNTALACPPGPSPTPDDGPPPDDDPPPSDETSSSSGQDAHQPGFANDPGSNCGCGNVGKPIHVADQSQFEKTNDLHISLSHGLSFDLNRTYSSAVLMTDQSDYLGGMLGWNPSGVEGTRSHWMLDDISSQLRRVVWRETELHNSSVMTIGSLKVSHVAGGPPPTMGGGMIAMPGNFAAASIIDDGFPDPYLLITANSPDNDVASFSSTSHTLSYKEFNGSYSLFYYESTDSAASGSSLYKMLSVPDSAQTASSLTYSVFGRDEDHELSDVKNIYVVHIHAALPQWTWQSSSTPFVVTGNNSGGVLDAMTDPTPNLTAMGTAGYLVLFRDGSGAYYDSDGKLMYRDQCPQNNLASGSSGFVDDFIKYNWQTVSGRVCVTSIEAPPLSDGRTFSLSYNGSGALTSVSLNSGGLGTSGGAKTLMEYEYYSSGRDTGKLFRAINSDVSGVKNGVSYGYGSVANTGSDLSFSWPSSGKDPKLDYKEVYYYDGSTTHQYPLSAVKYDYSGGAEPYPATEEWLYDSAAELWRKSLSIAANEDGTKSVVYEMGQKANGSERYDGLADNATNKPTDIYHFDGAGQVDYVESTGLNMERPQTRTVYVSGTTRVNHQDLLVSNDTDAYSNWVPMQQYYYNTSDPGNPRVSQMTRFLDFEHSGSGEFIPTSYASTYVTYDSTYPEKPSRVLGPDGTRIDYEYGANGRVDRVRLLKNYNSSSQYDLFNTIHYTYLSSGVNAGMVNSIAHGATGLSTHTTNIYYYGSTTTGGALLGKPHIVKLNVGEDDQQTVIYEYNGYGQPRRVNVGGKTTKYDYDYSYVPARLKTITDPTSATTRLGYDGLGNVNIVVNPDNSTADYTYDPRGNLIESKAADASSTTATTTLAVDIFDNLLQLTDPVGNITAYTYDARDRQRSESAYGTSAGVAPKYSIFYGYTGLTGAGCSSCATGALGSVAWRAITDGTTSQTLSFTYDLAGRLRTQFDHTGNKQIEYNYTGLKLTSITHDGGLWANDDLQFKYDSIYGRLVREVYPNGRYTEFTYDSANRLASVKDPFGFINTLGYDSKERLGSLKHSTLGEADFSYDDGTDLLSRLTLGNGAYTDYTYDSLNRLTAFDLRQSNATQIVKHSWSYDNLGRKDASAGITAADGLGGWNPTKLDFTYDAASRVTEEKLKNGGTTLWDVTYGYDKSGNRTSVNDGTINKTIGYGAANRETSVASSTTLALQYDYKGNVTVRPPLAGGNAYHYTWDAYDRLTTATRTGQVSANYKYDAFGRLLYRGENNGTTVTANYWLGLTPLATEQWGSEPGRNSAVYRPDAETTSNPVATGYWGPRTINSANGHMEYSTDSVRGKVGHIYATDTSRACFMLGDRAEDDWNSTASSAPFADSSHRHVGLWMKFTGPGSDSFYVVLTLRSIDGSSTTHEHYMVYQTISGSPYIQNGNEDRHPIGESWEDGSWHYFERDLEKDLKDLFPSETVTYVDSIYFIANNLYVDDIVFSGGMLKRSFAVVPGAPIGGALGSWTGSNVAQENGNKVRYFQYNDLGTVIAQTKTDGAAEGAWEPDFYGNYANRQALNGSPSRPELGLTGQVYDSAVGGYGFGLRTLDSERGRWLEPEPLGLDGPNLYHFGFGDPVNGFDPNGLDWWYNRLKDTSNFFAGWGDTLSFGLSGLARSFTPGATAVNHCSGSYRIGEGIATIHSTLIGANGLSSGLKGLSIRAKGAIGEALSFAENTLSGSTNLATHTRSIPGFRTIVDSTWQSTRGAIYYVESKFGTSALSPAQRAAANALGSQYHVERWGYDFFSRIGGYLGFGAAAGSAISGNDCPCQ